MHRSPSFASIRVDPGSKARAVLTHRWGSIKPENVSAFVYMNEERRLLRFENLSEIMPEVRRLAPAHRTVGNWSLGQTCQHLSKSFNGSVEGFDLSRHRIKRFFIKKRMLEVALTKGIPRNWLVDAHLTPAPHVDLENGMADLEAAIERYREHRGGLHAHPLFGNMSREVWDQVHCVHSAHHLSFVLPVEPIT